jgi:hypothetical protein
LFLSNIKSSKGRIFRPFARPNNRISLILWSNRASGKSCENVIAPDNQPIGKYIDTSIDSGPEATIETEKIMMRQRPFLSVVTWAMVLGLTATANMAMAEDKKDSAGWTQLFNGKDLTGWKIYVPDGEKASTGLWKVEDGAIVGNGPASHLFSERNDYRNFHYRIEAMINDGGNSGQYFRTQYAKGFPPGYEAQINSTHRDPVKTGSLYGFKNALVKEILVKPNEWFTQEVIADGDHIIIKVNGKVTVDIHDPDKKFTKGHFALQQHHDGSIVKFRKIEIKELPAKE